MDFSSLVPRLELGVLRNVYFEYLMLVFEVYVPLGRPSLGTRLGFFQLRVVYIKPIIIQWISWRKVTCFYRLINQGNCSDGARGSKAQRYFPIFIACLHREHYEGSNVLKKQQTKIAMKVHDADGWMLLRWSNKCKEDSKHAILRQNTLNRPLSISLKFNNWASVKVTWVEMGWTSEFMMPFAWSTVAAPAFFCVEGRGLDKKFWVGSKPSKSLDHFVQKKCRFLVHSNLGARLFLGGGSPLPYPSTVPSLIDV